MDRSDIVSSLLWLLVSAFVCMTSLHLGIGVLQNPGPGFVPFWSGILLFIFASSLGARSLRKRGLSGPSAPLWRGLPWGKTVVILVALGGYCFILQKLGYLLSTLGLMLILFGLGKTKPWLVILTSLVTVLVSYFVFAFLLEAPLPGGVLRLGHF